MLGNVLSQDTGQIVGIRVLTPTPDGRGRVEVTFEAQGKLLTLDSHETATYISEQRPDGFLEGVGSGLLTTSDGERVTWTGTGIGRFTGGGNAVSFRGSLIFKTTAERLEVLNGACGVFEFETDDSDKTASTVYFWK